MRWGVQPKRRTDQVNLYICVFAFFSFLKDDGSFLTCACLVTMISDIVLSDGL